MTNSNNRGYGVDDWDRHSRFMRLKEVCDRIGVSRSTIYRWVEEGNFPKPKKLGLRTIAWQEREIESWVLSRFSI